MLALDMSKIVKMTPFLSHKIWGGNLLKKLKNINAIADTQDPLGESWEVSSLSDGSSKIGEKLLSELCELSYLVKFIDTSANLSIQVHPDDDYAKAHENSSGKTECWLILDSIENGGIYLGLKSGVTKKEFFNAIYMGLAVDKFLNFYPVERGDFFFVPAGAIHAIGAGVLLCEIQQSSGITYRVWDWNRVDSSGNARELHIEKAKDTINFDESFNRRLEMFFQKKLLVESGINTLVRHRDFNVEIYNFSSQKEMNLKLGEKSSLVVLDGKIRVNDLEISEYESTFVLESGTFDLKILTDKASFISVI